MSAQSKIEWTDRTWSVTRGCSVVSPGCHNCYAMKFAHRFSGHGRAFERLTKQTKAGPQWTGEVRQIEEALLEPLRWKKPARVFVNSMSDLFHEAVPFEFIDRVFAVMALAPRHTFQILTKRPERMLDYCKRRPNNGANQFVSLKGYGSTCVLWGHMDLQPWPLPNVWLGVSVENQETADERIPLLLQTPAAIRFVSYEPALGPVDLGLISATCACCRPRIFASRWVHVHRTVRPAWPLCLAEFAHGLEAPAGLHRANSNQHGALDVNGMGLMPDDVTALPSLDWVIVGGESGYGARHFNVEWARSTVEQCQAAGVPVFVKQLGANITNGFWSDEDTESEPCVLTLRDRKGGDPAEWPEDLRVRQFPGGHQ